MSFRPARLAAVAAAAVVTIGSATSSPAQADPSPVQGPSARSASAALDAFEDQLLTRINQVRAAHGLKGIGRVDSCVDKMAESWSDRIASTGVLAHRDQRQVLSQCDQSWAGENLVRGVGLTPGRAVEAWMASPAHRDVLLKGRARRAGIAVTVDGRGRYVGVLNFTDPQ